MTAKISTTEILKAIDRLVREGRIEHAIVNGKPGVRLTAKGLKEVSNETIIPPHR